MKQPNKKPNILILMSDQLNANVLSTYGGEVETPNIDSIAKDGVTFLNATCTHPTCSPSRASIVTGQYLHTHGIVCNINRRDYPGKTTPQTEEGIKNSDITTEKLLYENGYDTHHYGKWHILDEDLEYYTDMFGLHEEYMKSMSAVFEKVKTLPKDKWMDWYNWQLPATQSKEFKSVVEQLGTKWDHINCKEFITKLGKLDLPIEQTYDYMTADCTINRLKNLSKTKPFMITCSLNYPHDPNLVPSPYYEMFDPKKVRLPKNYDYCEKRFDNDWGRKVVKDLGEVGAREFVRVYYGMVKALDDQIGRVLKTLKDVGQYENTIIIFTADHGDMNAGHGMVWKSTTAFYDEIVRVPLIISYPGVVKPQHSDIVTDLTDIMPTILDFTGLKIPTQAQGYSLVPYLTEQKTTTDRKYALCERIQPTKGHFRKITKDNQSSFMLRNKEWKYVLYPDGDEYLYDLTTDSGEIVNLANNTKYKSIKDEIKNGLDNFLKTTYYPK